MKIFYSHSRAPFFHSYIKPTVKIIKKIIIENTLGLVGESGEVAEKIKKCIRDNHEPNKMELIKELGDVLFYVTALANHIESDLETVAIHNIAKLQDRKNDREHRARD